MIQSANMQRKKKILYHEISITSAGTVHITPSTISPKVLEKLSIKRTAKIGEKVYCG